jgi:acyl carrier protein
LPKTATGKVDRGALAAAPLSSSSADHSATNISNSAHQDLVRQIWLQVLGIQAVPEGVTFFDLGGDSLGLVRVQAEINKFTGQQVPLRKLIQLITVEKTASYLDTLRGIAKKYPID